MRLDRSAFIALRSRNYRLLWIGLVISTSGSMMQMAAILWHVSLLAPPERKGLMLGLVGLVRVVPIVAFSLVSGAVADAFDRRKVMLVTQCCLAVVAGTLALITFRGHEALLPIYVLAALGSAAGSFDGPARQSLFPNLVPVDALPNAISLNTIMFQIASVVGPTLSGIVIATLGVGWVYLLNALSFFAVIVALLWMRDVPRRVGVRERALRPEAIREGLRFVFRAPLIRSTMLLDFFATFFSSATALLPIFAQDILHVGAKGYGWLYAAPSVGALAAGAAMVHFVERIEKRGRTLILAVLGYGAATVVFGLSRSFWLTFLCLGLTGATDTVSMVLRNIVRQLSTPDHLRGRMTSINMIFFMGGPQLGEMEAGAVASWLGAPSSVVLGGVACLGTTMWVARKTPALLNYRRRDALLRPETGERGPGDEREKEPVEDILQDR